MTIAGAALLVGLVAGFAAKDARLDLRRQVSELAAAADRDHAAGRFLPCAQAYAQLWQLNLGGRAAAAYNEACCLALAGRKEPAFAALERAVGAGFSDATVMAKDADLATLRKDPRWAAMLARVRAAPGPNEALRKTLIAMGQEDQAEAQRSYGPGDPGPGRSAQRQALLKQILDEYGWPGIALVGVAGAAGAWIVAQHADGDVAFQRRCLTLMEAAYEKGQVPGLHLAYLTDRVLVAERKPQRYGTQGAPRYSPEEAAAVNERRRKLGLGTMAEVAREKGAFYEKAYREARQGR